MKRADNSKNLKPFKKGPDSRRNLKGRKPKLPELDELLAKVLSEEKSGITAAEIMIKALLTKAKKGDVRAAEVLMDRGYGKAKQSIQMEGNLGITGFTVGFKKENNKE